MCEIFSFSFYTLPEHFPHSHSTFTLLPQVNTNTMNQHYKKKKKWVIKRQPENSTASQTKKTANDRHVSTNRKYDKFNRTSNMKINYNQQMFICHKNNDYSHQNCVKKKDFIKVLSWNINYDKHSKHATEEWINNNDKYQLIYNQISAQNADIVALQELPPKESDRARFLKLFKNENKWLFTNEYKTSHIINECDYSILLINKILEKKYTLQYNHTNNSIDELNKWPGVILYENNQTNSDIVDSKDDAVSGRQHSDVKRNMSNFGYNADSNTEKMDDVDIDNKQEEKLDVMKNDTIISNSNCQMSSKLIPKLMLYSIHFMPQRVQHDFRRKEFEEVYQQSIKQDMNHVFACIGDTNMRENEERDIVQMSQGRLKSCWDCVPFHLKKNGFYTWHWNFFDVDSDYSLRFDRMFMGQSIETHSIQIFDQCVSKNNRKHFLSDHRGLVVTIKL